MNRAHLFGAEYKHNQISTRILSERCTELLEKVPVRCDGTDFDEALSNIYDPQGKILVVRDRLEVEEENWAEAQRQAEQDAEGGPDDRSFSVQGHPAPDWVKKIGGLANRVGHAFDGGKRPVGVPGPVPHLQGVWAP
ncbi:MAG: hypothetical protein M1816_007186 [Peltula sp. TS41687]|nr:MAG: hypothetical protein M1816_007186 [Peltula sp. TS41687]